MAYVSYIVKALGYLLGMKWAEGYRTYVAAAGFFGLAAYQFSQGSYDLATQSLLAALAAAGLRAAVLRAADVPKVVAVEWHETGDGSAVAGDGTLMPLAKEEITLAYKGGLLVDASVPPPKPKPPTASVVLSLLALFATAGAAAAQTQPIRRILPIDPPAAISAQGNDPIRKLPPSELVPEKTFGTFEQTADWGIGACDVPAAWKRTKGKGVKVGIVDTGIDINHPEFKGRIAAVRNFVPGRGVNDVTDIPGHGTHCAGIVGAADDDTGTVGVAPEVTFYIAKVLGDDGSGASTWIAAGIDWLVAEGCDVISGSLGGSDQDPYTLKAIRAAVAKNVIVVFAAGNDGPGEGTVGYPGGYDECICVASINKQILTSRYSSRGRQVDITAPGEQIRSTYPGGRYATLSGTSMATPFVSGCAALYVADARARGATPTVADFRALMASTARDLPPVGPDTASGAGLIQPAKILGSAAPPPTDPLPKPDVIEFGPGDLTPGGLDKWRRILPTVEGLTFKLKAAPVAPAVPPPAVAPLPPAVPSKASYADALAAATVRPIVIYHGVPAPDPLGADDYTCAIPGEPAGVYDCFPTGFGPAMRVRPPKPAPVLVTGPFLSPFGPACPTGQCPRR